MENNERKNNRNVFYAIALILGVYVLINKRKEKKDGKEE